MEHPDGIFQVVLIDAVFESFSQWLASKDMHLVLVEPDAHGLPTYGIGID